MMSGASKQHMRKLAKIGLEIRAGVVVRKCDCDCHRVETQTWTCPDCGLRYADDLALDCVCGGSYLADFEASELAKVLGEAIAHYNYLNDALREIFGGGVDVDDDLGMEGAVDAAYATFERGVVRELRHESRAVLIEVARLAGFGDVRISRGKVWVAPAGRRFLDFWNHY